MPSKTLSRAEREDIARLWISRADKASQYYQDWSDRFKCDKMEEYYYGFQWDDNSVEHYVINYVFSTIEIKKPGLLFQNPVFRVKAKPGKSDWDLETAARKATLREDMLYTVFSDKETDIATQLELFITDAFFRFGVLEVGYEADWIMNPNAGKPVLRSDETPYFDDDNNIIKEPDELPEEEKIYVRRIFPWRFRVGGVDGPRLRDCSWVGYYSYVRVEDLRSNKLFNIDDDIQWAGHRSEDFVDPADKAHVSDEQMDLLKSGDLVKVWKIWDLRRRERMLIASAQKYLIHKQSYNRLPFATLRFVPRLRGWYPLPLTFNWKNAQDEINDGREAMRVHRKRFKRIYLYKAGTFEDMQEINKIENGPDGVWAETTGDPSSSVVAAPLAQLDSAASTSMIVSKDDFNIISGTSAEMRAEADRTTATQSNIIDTRARIREDFMQERVATALCEVARLVLLTAQDKMVLPFWIKSQVDSHESMLQEVQETTHIWQEITATDLGGDEDFEINIIKESMSPMANEEEKKKYLEFLALLQAYPQIALSPILIRETAYRVGYRNEKIIKEMQNMAILQMLGQMQQGAGALNQASNAGQTQVEQMTPPANAEIQNQLSGQLQ